MRAVVVLVLVFLGLASCEQRYRYACQNPENWESAQCQKPLCEVNQDCPDHVFIDQKRMDPYINRGAAPAAETKETDKGGKNDCAK